MIQSSQGEMKFSGSRERHVIEVSVTITTRKVSPHEETHFSWDSVLKKGRNTTGGRGGRSRREETSKNSKAAFLFSSSTRKYLRGVRSRGEKGNRPRPRPTTGWKVKGRKLQPEPINVHIEFFRQTHPAPDYGRDNVIRNNFIYVYISSRPNADIHVSNFISRGRVSRVLFHVDCAAINA